MGNKLGCCGGLSRMSREETKEEENPVDLE